MPNKNVVDKSTVLLKATAIGLGIAVIIAVPFVFNVMHLKQAEYQQQEQSSLEERIELLEQQMLEKTRPVINVSHATIYNTDGEIVLETHDQVQ